MKNSPDFSFITSSFISNYDETSLINSSLMFLGLLAMYYISSYTVKERDKARLLFYEEHEKLLKEQIAHEKEFVFTKRIYHTYHKAEKVMAFMKLDLKALSAANMESIKFRMTKYANFISRVIHDMNWFEPPIQTIRSQMFQTDVNEVIRFLVDHLFLRISKATSLFSFRLELGDNVPPVGVNEFVVWEILEPLIQNSLQHAAVNPVEVTIATHYDETEKRTQISITDNGVGIQRDLLERNAQGLKRIFLENVTTKQSGGQSFGYGCYIAYDLATVRCGWMLDAVNLPAGGCQFILTIEKS